MKFNFTITYPTTLDTLSNPTSGNGLNSPDHATQHADANDAIEALEAKVGINSSAVTSSHDYKLSGVTGTDKAVSKTGTETLTNKTLTSPVINLGTNATGDMYYRDSGGAFQRLAIGTAGQILDVSAGGIPEWIANPAAASASYSTAGVMTTDANVRYYAADASGSSTAYVATMSPAPSAYVTGQNYRVKFVNANTTTTPTLNLNSLGAKTIVKGVSTALAVGDIAANMVCTLHYDGTNFVLQNPVNALLSAVTTFKNGIDSSRAGDAASSTQNIAHGLGVVPKKIRISAMWSDSAHAAANYYVLTSIGVYNGTTTSCVWHEDYSAGTNQDAGTSNTNIVYLQVGNASGIQAATVTVDSTNIILSWTKTGGGLGATNAINILWEAEA